MFRNVLLTGVVAAMSLLAAVANAQVLPMWGGRSNAGCGCDVACCSAPSCTAPGCGMAPTCGASACGCEPSCGCGPCCDGPRFPLLGRVLDRIDRSVTNGFNCVDNFFGRFRRDDCCCAPSCSMPACGCEPACGMAPSCGAPAACCPAPMSCVAPSCEAPAACGCEPSCAAPVACCSPAPCGCGTNFRPLANARDLLSDMLFSRRFNDCGCADAGYCAAPACGCDVAPSCGCGAPSACNACGAGGMSFAPPQIQTPQLNHGRPVQSPMQAIPPAPPVDTNPTPAIKGEQARSPIVLPPVRVNVVNDSQPKLIRPSSLQQASPAPLHVEAAKPATQWTSRK